MYGQTVQEKLYFFREFLEFWNLSIYTTGLLYWLFRKWPVNGNCTLDCTLALRWAFWRSPAAIYVYARDGVANDCEQKIQFLLNTLYIISYYAVVTISIVTYYRWFIQSKYICMCIYYNDKTKGFHDHFCQFTNCCWPMSCKVNASIPLANYRG